VVYNPKIEYAATTGFHDPKLGYLFPALFVTVACGAISGFHSLVGSGTTSKQINRETDAKLVGYGGMLIESLLAVLALVTVATMARADYDGFLGAGGGGPVAAFSAGLGTFIASLGIPKEAAVSFVALAVSAFALTSLDTGTRLCRFCFQEFFEPRTEGAKPSILATNRYLATAAWRWRWPSPASGSRSGRSSARPTSCWPPWPCWRSPSGWPTAPAPPGSPSYRWSSCSR
jgi:carbon starvation protein